MSRSPIPAHAGSRIGRSGWWALADDDQRPLAGPFNTIGEAGDVATAISEGRAWRYGADTRMDQVNRGHLGG